MTVAESILLGYFSGLRHMLQLEGTDDNPLWRLQMESSILMAVHSLQNVTMASIGENLPVAIRSAILLAVDSISGMDSSSLSILSPRFEPRYWLIAACVVLSFLAAATWDRLCLVISFFAMSDLNAGRISRTISSHGGRMVHLHHYNTVNWLISCVYSQGS